jgi:ferredoxin-thioredoxin reductase catalytic subunit
MSGEPDSGRNMTPGKLYETLKPVQEAKGYHFNRDMRMVLDILEQLLATKARYGYMACPCRLASGDYQKDRDILCPCAYRAADVEEFGACFCGLYASRACNAGQEPWKTVPERRPVEKILA